MKNQYVNTLQEGDYVNDYFIAIRKDVRSKQSGGKFLGMVFKDRTGEIGGVMWNNAVDTANMFELGDVVNVRGRVNLYQNRLQLQVEQVLPLNESDYNLEDLIHTPGNLDADLAAFKKVLDTVQHPKLKELIACFWNDTEFLQQFKIAAAAKKWHHEYQGGLLRHCLEMSRIAELMCELYPNIDRDVLLVGVFLHDLGKLEEMSHEMFSDYTNAGKLLGHLQIGCDMLQKHINTIADFPEKLRLELLHMLLSHHGELAHGSPVLPKTLEAIVLHHIDNLDAQAAAFSRIVHETKEKRQEWSDYMPLIERVVWTKGK